MKESNSEQQPQATRLVDYKPSPYQMEEVHLTFDLFDTHTITVMRAKFFATGEQGAPLFLNGKDLELLNITMDDKELSSSQYEVSKDGLKIANPPAKFTLEITSKIHPETNTALEGLYKSGGRFCTQCEAEGFRRITYFLDRPDVLTRYTTKIIADKAKYPILLANGNLEGKGNGESGRHFAVWKDPFPKPSYLFALVAGDLACLEDNFTTMSGRKVKLQIWVEKHNVSKCHFAMQAVKDSMAWDERIYGREYDLDIFMIVAVPDFNMGAMENKGLNIFNDKYILANPEVATDTDFEGIQSVVAHEYFHNWSGNRVTVRDWFQLSLKEGFTVFRDQQFSSDMVSPTSVRIDSVRNLRASQFAEDKSPMAHPVKPDSYIEIANFYTPTVYEKGAEVVRMIHTILGSQNFRKATDDYFASFDGQAVTTEDFIGKMRKVYPSLDWDQFELWYKQAGTPQVKAKGHYEKQRKEFTLTLSQTIPDTPGQTNKKPHIIPIKTGLIGRSGKTLGDEKMLLLSQAEQKFTFEGVEEEPVPSLLRDFSAPIELNYDYSPNDLACLMMHDTNAFNRFEAHQKLATLVIKKAATEIGQGKKPHIDSSYIEAIKSVLDKPTADKRFLANLVSLPGFTYLINQDELIPVDDLFAGIEFVRQQIGKQLYHHFTKLYADIQSFDDTDMSREAINARELKFRCLLYLAATEDDEAITLAVKQARTSRNMTDSLRALSILADYEFPLRTNLLQEFFNRWQTEHLVINKWFSIQTGSLHPNVLGHFENLLEHPLFNILNPNRVYSVFLTFFSVNPQGLHHPSGKGYKIYADYILKIDQTNSSVAAHLAKTLSRFQRYDHKRQELVKAELRRILENKSLSNDVFEIINAALK
jgi:aminopeptidase N